MDGVVAKDFMITNEESKLRLFLRNKHQEGAKSFSAEKTILYVHGTTQPSEAIFDLEVEGMSFADYLASEGYDVWYVNIRGYGRSEAPDTDKPFATTEEALSDVDCAIHHIFKLRKIKKISLIGWSWGTIIIGAYAARFPKNVSNLVLIGAPWISKASETEKTIDKAWQEWTTDQVCAHLRKGAPGGAKSFPRSTRHAWEMALIESQPESLKHSPAKFRSPTGVLQDAYKYWRNGVAYYDPKKITARVLICAGGWDLTAPILESQALLESLTNASTRQLKGVPKSTHLMQIEQNRELLYHHVQTFLES